MPISFNQSSSLRSPQRSSRLEARQIRRQLANIDPSSSNLQAQCPLFNKLPAEIRNLIYNLAIDRSWESAPADSAQTRRFVDSPDEDCIALNQGTRLVDTVLLLTCRRVYFETAALPLKLYEVSGTTFTQSTRLWEMWKLHSVMQRMTARNVMYLSRMVLHLKFYYNLDRIQFLFRLPQFQPTHLRFTMPFPKWDVSVIKFSYPIYPSFQRTLWPASLRTMTIEFYSPPNSLGISNTALERWKEEFASVHELRLDLRGNVQLVQAGPVTFYGPPDHHHHRARIVLSDGLPANITRKVPPHLNRTDA